MILSAGLTPAWQQILVFDRFRYGEVNRAAEAVWCAAGKVLNAAVAAHQLGGPTLALATVGGPPRRDIERELDALGVPHRWVVTEAATRVCTTIIERSTAKITELVENGRPLAPKELDRFRRAYAKEAARADAVVLIGSLPADTPPSYYRELLEKTPCPAVLDFRGPGLLSVLDLKPYVAKPNREELAHTVGRPLDKDEDLVQAMQALNARGAQWVVVTNGSRPVWVTSASKVYRLDPLPVKEVVNPIGSGDAKAATIAWATAGGREPIEAVRLGIAAAADRLRQLLPGRVDRAKVRSMAAGIPVEELT